MSIATADNFKATNPKPFNEWERYNNGDGTYRDWANNTEVTNFFAAAGMSSTWMANKFYWIAGNYSYYTGSGFLVIGAADNYKGSFLPDSAAPANPESKPIWGDVSNTTEADQTYPNFLTNTPDGSGGYLPVVVPAGKYGKLSFDGSSWSFVEATGIDTSGLTPNGGSTKTTEQIDKEKADAKEVGLPVLVDYNIDYSAFLTAMGVGSIVMNNMPTLKDGKLSTFNTKAVVGTTISIKIYQITGVDGSLVFTLLHTYTSFMTDSENYTMQIDDNFIIPAGSYVAVDSAGIFFGPSSLGYFATSKNSLQPGNGMSFDFTIDETVLLTGTPVGRINALEAVSNAATIVTQNLYDISAVTHGKSIAANGTISDGAYVLTDYIPVIPGKTYYVDATNWRSYCYFLDDKTQTTGGGDMLGHSSFTVPVNRKWIRMSIPSIANTTSDNHQIQADTPVISWDPFGSINAQQQLLRYASKLAMKVFVSFGDSIAAMERWQYFILLKIAMKHINCGIGGTRISGGDTIANAMSSPTRLAALPAADLYVINGGMNDWRGNVAIGVYTDTTPATVYGGLYVILNYIQTNYPNAKVILNTITFGKLVSGIVNTGGLTTADYSEAIKDFGRRNNIPVADLSSNGGWNQFNIGNFCDTETNGDQYHPNVALGGPTMANVIYKKIEEISEFV